VNVEDIKKVLKTDAPQQYAEQGLYLEHSWQNVNDSEEVVFLFQIEHSHYYRSYVSIGEPFNLKGVAVQKRDY
jgi:hypothetical protein